MTNTTPPKALILDLGNVLIFHDNDTLYRELAAASGTTTEAVVTALRSDAGQRMNVTDGPPELVYELVAPAIGFPGSLDQFAAIWNGIFQPNQPIVPVIEALHGRIPLFVLSNTNAMHIDYIRARLPVLARFDAVLTSHELGLVKPDAAIFQAAPARAGVPPHEPASFDDLPDYVEAVRRAGLQAFLFTTVQQFIEDPTSLGLRLA